MHMGGRRLSHSEASPVISCLGFRFMWEDDMKQWGRLSLSEASPCGMHYRVIKLAVRV